MSTNLDNIMQNLCSARNHSCFSSRMRTNLVSFAITYYQLIFYSTSAIAIFVRVSAFSRPLISLTSAINSFATRSLSYFKRSNIGLCFISKLLNISSQVSAYTSQLATWNTNPTFPLSSNALYWLLT